MPVEVDEIAPDIYRLCTFVPEVPPSGFTFNQFLVVDDEPLLYHAGPRLAFPDIPLLWPTSVRDCSLQHT